jgi:hypothetical protein
MLAVTIRVSEAKDPYKKKLDDEEFGSYVLVGLDLDYNSVVSSITTRTEPISFAELYSQLLAHENRLDL